MSGIYTEIPQIDNEGAPVNVITNYKVDTISLVKGNALGRNFTKLKSLTAPDKEGGVSLTTQAKINKAKALDAVITPEGAEVTAVLEITIPAVLPEVVIPVIIPEEVVPVVVPVVVAGVVVPEGDIPIVITEVVAEVVAVEKAKTFTTDELGDVTKSAIDAIGALFKELLAKSPEASQWDVFDLITSAAYKVDEVLWWENQGLRDKIWDEVYEEVALRITKSKSLLVTEATDPITAMKAFALVNPVMGQLLLAEMETQKAKTLSAELAQKVTLRAKALEAGAVKFKRLSTEDNTTDNIVDALSTIETESPEAFVVISKALTTASGILMGGDLFADIGLTGVAEIQSEADFVTMKAKSLVDMAAVNGKTMNMAAARATARQSEEFKELYQE